MKRKYPLLLISILAATQALAWQRADSTHAMTDTAGLALKEVVVSANSNLKRHVETLQMGKLDIPVTLLAKVPAIGGEPDIIKALQLTPGVKRGTEGSIGMYVRGGGNDENLIMMDGAPVYNAGHLLGFFSVFNTSALRDVQMYKSSFPAQYGGRLSSVLDVKTKEASLTDYKGNVSLGLISSAATIQVPIIKDKLSIMVSGRRTYIDKVFSYIPYHFYDGNTKLTYVLNSRNRLYLSGYMGNDVLKASQMGDTSDGGGVKTSMSLGNKTGTLRWNYIGENGSYSSDLSLFFTQFSYNIGGSMGGNRLSMHSAIRDLGMKEDFRYNWKAHRITTGFSITNHFFNPNIVSSAGNMLEKFGNSPGKKIYSNEVAAYVNDEYHIDDKWQASAGLRLSGAQVTDKVYINPEPRMGLRYLISDRASVKASYARMAQYMHLVSSSSLALPTDLWYPATAAVKPGLSDQVSVGYYYTIPSVQVSLSAEAYYKWMHHLIEYREGALLILNDNYEKELVQGKGRGYGIELFASKTAGHFTGWLGYSLSFAHRQFDSLNKGKDYYARYDRRHDLSFVGMYDINNHWGFCTNIVYATGSPFTGQKSQYMVPKPDFSGFDILPAYTGRNELRMSAAFRIDLDLSYKFSIGKRIKADAHLNVYNLLNRAQPNSVKRVWDDSKKTYVYQQNGLFGTITTGSINFSF